MVSVVTVEVRFAEMTRGDRHYSERAHSLCKFSIVVSSRPCSEGFSPGSPVFLPPQKLTFLNSN